MSPSVTIVDYGVGNLFSVRRSLEFCGCTSVLVSSRPEDLESAGKLILPGVGAFEDGMRGLRDRDLIQPIVRFAKSGRPLLGICLGMQMLATESEEFGKHAGLNLLAGRVVPIPRTATDGSTMKVPFIGWKRLAVSSGRAGSLLESHDVHRSVYLVHSFHVVPSDPGHVLATYDFGGNSVTAAIRMDNITGVQFHPEKSGETGLEMMRRFLAGP